MNPITKWRFTGPTLRKTCQHAIRVPNICVLQGTLTVYLNLYYGICLNGAGAWWCMVPACSYNQPGWDHDWLGLKIPMMKIKMPIKLKPEPQCQILAIDWIFSAKILCWRYINMKCSISWNWWKIMHQSVLYVSETFGKKAKCCATFFRKKAMTMRYANIFLIWFLNKIDCFQ